jgi:hypothetical protein
VSPSGTGNTLMSLMAWAFSASARAARPPTGAAEWGSAPARARSRRQRRQPPRQPNPGHHSDPDGLKANLAGSLWRLIGRESHQPTISSGILRRPLNGCHAPAPHMGSRPVTRG